MGKLARKQGFLISFEGGEGAGKSTQMKRLAAFLKRKGYSVVLTLQPGGTEIGKKIREVLLNPKNRALCERAELLLYEADRAQHIDTLVRPALAAGKMVLSDRFFDSSTVYQGICRGLGKKWVESLNLFATDGLKPDLTLVFDLPENVGRARVLGRFVSDKKMKGKRRVIKLDRIERERSSFHRKVRLGFLKLAKEEPKRICVVDAEQPLDDVTKAMQTLVTKRLGI